jgi:hypothetical protein
MSWRLRQRLVQGGFTYRVLRHERTDDLQRVQIWKQIVKMGLALGMFGIDTTFGALLRDRSRFPYFENYVYEHSSEHLSRYSALRELVRSVKQAGGQMAGTPV